MQKITLAIFAAAVAALASTDDPVVVGVAQASAALDAGNYDRVEAVLLEAQKAAGNPVDDIRHARLLNAWSTLHLTRGQLRKAEDELAEALRITDGRNADIDLRASILHNLAAVEMRTARYDAALAHEMEAIRGMEKILPADDPSIIRSCASLASLQFIMGDPSEARASMERAIRSAERTYGHQPLLADLLNSDAVILDKLKLRAEAREVRRRARRITSAESQPPALPQPGTCASHGKTARFSYVPGSSAE